MLCSFAHILCAPPSSAPLPPPQVLDLEAEHLEARAEPSRSGAPPALTAMLTASMGGGGGGGKGSKEEGKRGRLKCGERERTRSPTYINRHHLTLTKQMTARMGKEGEGGGGGAARRRASEDDSKRGRNGHARLPTYICQNA